MAAAAGAPVLGFLVVPLRILGACQRGSSKSMFQGRGIAHIGDPVMVPMPPVMTLTGAIAGTVSFVIPLQGTIEQGSKVLRFDGRGCARVGDTVQVFFPPAAPFVGTIAGLPFAVPIAIVSPLRGFIQGGWHVRSA